MHTSRCIDAWSDFEDDVAHGELPLRESAHLHDGSQSDARVRVEAAQSLAGQYAVFSHDWHDVRRDAHGAEVEQARELVELNAVAGGECLHEFESYAAAREVGIGIAVVVAFRIKNRHGRRQFVVGNVVVANDEIDALFAGISHLLNGLDAAVEHNDEFHPHFGGEIDTFARDAVAFLIAVGDIEVDIGIELREELVDQCHRRASINVIIAINHDVFLASQRLVEPVNGHLHVVHQKRVVQVRELRTKETPGFGRRLDSAFQQQSPKCGVYVHLPRQGGCCGGLVGRRLFIGPFINH